MLIVQVGNSLELLHFNIEGEKIIHKQLLTDVEISWFSYDANGSDYLVVVKLVDGEIILMFADLRSFFVNHENDVNFEISRIRPKGIDSNINPSKIYQGPYVIIRKHPNLNEIFLEYRTSILFYDDGTIIFLNYNGKSTSFVETKLDRVLPADHELSLENGVRFIDNICNHKILFVVDDLLVSISLLDNTNRFRIEETIKHKSYIDVTDAYDPTDVYPDLHNITLDLRLQLKLPPNFVANNVNKAKIDSNPFSLMYLMSDNTLVMSNNGVEIIKKYDVKNFSVDDLDVYIQYLDGSLGYQLMNNFTQVDRYEIFPAGSPAIILPCTSYHDKVLNCSNMKSARC